MHFVDGDARRLKWVIKFVKNIYVFHGHSHVLLLNILIIQEVVRLVAILQ